jgi:Methyltransferase domain
MMPKLIETFIANLRPHAHIADLGAGDGRWSKVLAESGMRVLAVDRKEPAERHVGVEWHVGDVEGWLDALASSEKFDGFLLKNVLQFFEKEWVSTVLLPELRAHAAEGAVVCIETFFAPSEPPLKGQVSFYRAEELAVAFSGWKVLLQEESDDVAKDLTGNERRFHLARIILKNIGSNASATE